MYSGTGTALFDWIRTGREAIDFTILMDVQDIRNYQIMERRSRELGFKLLPSAPNPIPGCPDFGVMDIALVLRSQHWDIVESISWANAAVNLEILGNKAPETRLVFNPHTQPMWTLPAAHRFFLVPGVFQQMLQSSDCVFLDSPVELEGVTKDSLLGGRAISIPLGVSTETFYHRPAAIEHRILCVCDFQERRKRADLLFAGFAAARAEDSALRMNIGGSHSQNVALPSGIAGGVTRLGYVSLDELVRQYQSAKALVLLSDYEAFGLPIAEALCCGTPVIINRQQQVERIFEGLPGVYCVNNSDLNEVRDTILWVTTQAEVAREEIASAAAARFSLEATCGRKLLHIQELCGSAALAPAI